MIKDHSDPTDLKAFMKYVVDNKFHNPRLSAIRHLFQTVLKLGTLNTLEELKKLGDIKPNSRFYYSGTKNGVKRRRPRFLCVAEYTKTKELKGYIILYTFDIMFYTCPEFRRQGVASRLTNYLGKYYDIGFNVINIGDSPESELLRKKFKFGHLIRDLRQSNVFT